MKAGARFLAPSLDDHLWMVISDPALDQDRVVVVSVLSWTPRLDQACIVKPGEHPFVKHDTCVQYPEARAVALARLQRLLDEGKAVEKAPLSDELLARIRSSAAGADIPQECYDVLRRQGFVP